MLSRDDAAALLVASPLLDVSWWGERAGRRFADRDEAVVAWLEAWSDPPPSEPDGPDAETDAEPPSPHPLVEPVWLYPAGRWRRGAPDPLSYYLAHDAASRSPHPCYDLEELGPLEAWLADHDPAELLPTPVRRHEPDRQDEVVVVLEGHSLRSVVRWVRHLQRFDVGVVVPDAGGHRRVLSAVTATMPRVTLSQRSVASGLTEVTVGPHARPPVWPWLRRLLEALAAHPDADAVQAPLVDDDQLLVGPLLPGHPVAVLDRLEGAVLPDPPARLGALEARRAGRTGPAVLTTRTWLPGSPEPDRGADRATPAWRALADRATRVQVVEGTPSLRWSLDISAPAGPIGRRWGDWAFARSLGEALARLGQQVEVDHPETRGRATRDGVEVVLALRGLEPVPRHPGAAHLLWVISHPDRVDAAELADADTAFAASTAWASARGVTALPQCTDVTRFHPAVVPHPRTDGALFVGNARGGMRPVVAAAREAGVPLTVVGADWARHGVEALTDRVANEDLPALYARAEVVLADHHDDMRERGFVANRAFDVLAVGGRLLTDEVAGLTETLGVSVPTWRTAADLARLVRPPYDAWPDADARRVLAERVVAEHSFDARARTLLDAAIRLRCV